MIKQFEWNEDTINYFTELEELNGIAHVSKRILEFVINDCDLEDGETIQDLFNDILNKVEINLQTKYDSLSII
jgi:hypothetical protein